MERFLGGRSPEALMQLMDQDRDGQVSFEEFRRAVQGERLQGQRRTSVPYQVGQEVQYWSRSHGAWIDCTITAIDHANGAVQVSCKPDCWLLREDLRSLRLRTDAVVARRSEQQAPSYRKGQEVLLWSTTFNTWIPCRVTLVDEATGYVQVDQKPQYWFHGRELVTRLKPVDGQGPGRGSAKAAVARQVLAGAFLQHQHQ